MSITEHSHACRLLGVAMLVLVISACGGPDRLIAGDFAFVNVNVLSMDGAGVLEEQAVIVADGRIVAIGGVDEIGPEEGVEVIEADGLYLLPGLTEMHGHLPDPRQSDIDIKNLLFLYVANGVTTVRGMQGDPSQFILRDQINHGLLVGPRVYLGSMAIDGGQATTAAEAEQQVRQYKVAGYDLIKVHEGLTVEAFDALARTAAEVGIPFGGHVPNLVGLRHALASGQSSIDHLDNYVEALVTDDVQLEEATGLRGVVDLVADVDESRIPELVRATVDAGSWVVPTMVLWESVFFGDRESIDLLSDHPEVRYMPPETVARWMQAVDDRFGATSVETNRRVNALRRTVLQALHRGGAKIVLGTDSPQIFSVPGFAMHREMALYVELGMTPYEVLEIATRRPAEYFRAVDEFGTVAEGRRADLLLLTANPLDDIGNVARRAGVMLKGRWFSEGEIQVRLGEMAQFYGN
jgi:imidazolonepropionase-like amidohydrolase